MTGRQIKLTPNRQLLAFFIAHTKPQKPQNFTDLSVQSVESVDNIQNLVSGVVHFVPPSINLSISSTREHGDTEGLILKNAFQQIKANAFVFL